jgi:hypothetical protein
MQLKILLRVQWTRLVVRGLNTEQNQQEGQASQRDIARVARQLLLCRRAFYSSCYSAGGHSTAAVTV